MTPTKLGSPSPPTIRTQENAIEVTHHEVGFRSLPAELEGAVLVQLSDFHRGCGGTDGVICDAIQIANGLNPDFVALTGDFVNEERSDIGPIVGMVSELEARRGVFATLGNHDHRSDAALLSSALRSAGIQVLHNQGIEVAPGFRIAGVDDLLEGKCDLPHTLAGIPIDQSAILLCHNPNGFDSVPPGADILVLAGHTHGGQIDIPIITPDIICRLHLHTSYVSGWFRRGSARLYVNRGIGVTGSGPLARRINCLPEISVFRFHRSE
jgi:predicted MPP superfamily phosphohydrolase